MVDICAPPYVVHLVEADNAPKSFCAQGSSTGAAAASANTAALPPGFSAANLPTGTRFGEEGNMSMQNTIMQSLTGVAQSKKEQRQEDDSVNR